LLQKVVRNLPVVIYLSLAEVAPPPLTAVLQNDDVAFEARIEASRNSNKNFAEI
jgi:hypothetical protein